MKVPDIECKNVKVCETSSFLDLEFTLADTMMA